MKSNPGQTSNFTSTSSPGIFLSTNTFNEKALGKSLTSHVFWRWMSENNRFCSLVSGSFYLALDALQSKTFYCGYSFNCHETVKIVNDHGLRFFMSDSWSIQRFWNLLYSKRSSSFFPISLVKGVTSVSVSLVTGCFDCDLAARKYRLVILCQL